MKLWAARQTWKHKDADEKAAALDYRDVKHIAVIKHGALGDLLMTRPMLVLLRESFPQAHLTLSVVSHYLRGVPDDLADEVHIVKGNEKDYGFRQSYASLHSLAPQDILFDISATSRSFWLSRFTQATLKIGFIHKGLQRLLYDVAVPRAHYRFEAETFMEQLNVIGLWEWPPRFAMNRPEPVRPAPYITYFATASVDNKCWPADRYAKLIRWACAKYPHYEHILLSGVAAWEKDVAADIVRATGQCDNFSLIEGGDQTPALIANTRMLVSADTGIRNMAIAYGTPTLGIFPQSATLFGYTPLFGHHVAVYNLYDYFPSLEQVQEHVVRLENELGNKGR